MWTDSKSQLDLMWCSSNHIKYGVDISHSQVHEHEHEIGGLDREKRSIKVRLSQAEEEIRKLKEEVWLLSAGNKVVMMSFCLYPCWQVGQPSQSLRPTFS